MSEVPGKSSSGKTDPGKASQPHDFDAALAARWEGIGQALVPAYPYHRALFIAFNVILTAINLFTGKPWWALWPLLVTGLVFTIHYLIFKASTVDDAWVEERAADLFDKSYDQGHIDWIAGRHEMETAADRRITAMRDEVARAAGRKSRPDDNDQSK